MHKVRCSYSQKQLETILNFATKKMVVHTGPFGVGKTHCLVEAFALYCYRLQQLGTVGLTFILAGRTQQAVKRNMCNVLAKKFGSDFKYFKGHSDGLDRDAVLFGQNIYIIGFNDDSSREKFQGITDIVGILHDECTLCKKEHLEYALGRLRGEIHVDGEDDIDESDEFIEVEDNVSIVDTVKLPEGTTTMWYCGSCNPEAPNHFIKKYIDDGVLECVEWHCEDAIWKGAKEQYDRLRKLYANNPSFLARYVLGEWASADRMVYPMFNPKVHIINRDDVEFDYKAMRHSFIAVDYGSDHPTAILLISKNWTGQYIVTKELKLERTAVSDIVIKIGDFIEFLHDQGCANKCIYVDPAAATLKDELRKAGLSSINAMNSHDEGIGCVRNMLALDQLFIFDNCENLIDEMYAYSFKDNNSGKDEVIKVGDDFCDALRYGVYTDSVIGGANE
jgi:hypothetical protein